MLFDSKIYYFDPRKNNGCFLFLLLLKEWSGVFKTKFQRFFWLLQNYYMFNRGGSRNFRKEGPSSRVSLPEHAPPENVEFWIVRNTISSILREFDAILLLF